MPFNANLFLSLMGSGQQPQITQQQSQPVDQAFTGHLSHSQPNPSQPTHPPTANTETEGRSRRCTEQNVVSTTSKILLEPEGDTLLNLWFEVLLFLYPKQRWTQSMHEENSIVLTTFVSLLQVQTICWSPRPDW